MARWTCRLRSPINWFGGKGMMVSKLLGLLNAPGVNSTHRTYVDPFGGGASLLFAKPPSPVEVYNDLDSGLVNFFRVLRDEKKFQRFYRLVSLTPYSREEYYFCRDTWEECADDVERAYRWFVTARQSLSGCHGASWSFVVTVTAHGMAKTCSRWLSCIEMLPEIHARMMRVQIEHLDFRRVFELYDTPETLFYCDPPYIKETRRSGDYRCEMTDDDHRDLVRILLNLQGKAMLSGYAHPIYAPLEEAGWQRVDFRTVCHAAGKTRASGLRGRGTALSKQPRVESVWLSPNMLTDNLFATQNETTSACQTRTGP